jgi:hypothetical protein
MPTNKEIMDAVEKYGSKAAAARALGMPVTTLKDRIASENRNKADDEIKAIRSLESQLASAKAKLDMEKQKRCQAESELKQSAETLDSILQSQDGVHLKKVKSLSKSKGQASAILCVNDWHVEGRVDPSTVGGVNEFNLEIAESRIGRLWQKAIYMLEFARGISDIRDMVIWLGGDLINGTIHEELSEANFLGPTEAILYVQEHVASGIDFLLNESELEHIHVVTSFGNHGRTTKKKHISTGYWHSWEWLAYNNLSRFFASNPKVSFQVEKGYHSWVDIKGYPVRFHHGDSVKYSGGVGGVTIPLRRMVAQWNKVRPAKLEVVAHFHQYLDAWDIVLCGGLVGYDAYAVSIGAEYQPPTQTFIVVDKNHGKVMSLPIFV